MRQTTMISLLVLGAAGCTSSGGGDGDDVTTSGAQLTIVGERDVRLENGWTTELTVRYTDLDGEPLSGQIDFTVSGETRGAFLSDGTALTDDDGMAMITLTAGEQGDTSFAIEAAAEDADPVGWNVDVLAVALEVAGDYRLTSELDLASGIPGTAGDVINTFIDMTDDPNDPATWVLDEIVANVDSDTVREFIEEARPALDILLKEVLIQSTPDIVARLIELGDAFGQVARRFGTLSTLQIAADPDDGFAAQHLLTDLVFLIDGDSFPMSLEEIGAPTPPATVAFDYDALRFQIGAHDFPLSYGTILMVALDQLIIPLVDPYAHDLESLLVNAVDCAAIGDALAEYIGFGSDDMYEGFCVLGIETATGWVEDQIRSLDGTAMRLGLSGAARWLDTNEDHTVDLLQGGVWEGAMTYGDTPAPLGESIFRGERIFQP
jgi:hypothetical protein